MAPDEFNIAASFGEVLLAATVSLLFGGGIPILYWVAAAGFALRCVFRYQVLYKILYQFFLYTLLYICPLSG
jgi:hypothetical protein